MAIKVRNKNLQDINEKDTGDSKKGNLIDSEDKSSLKTNKSYDLPDVRNFRAQAIKVLDILDSQGINIYDETRTPGMYLNRSKLVASKIIQTILKRDNNHKSTDYLEPSNESPNNTNNPVSFSLLQALKNNKNNKKI